METFVPETEQGKIFAAALADPTPGPEALREKLRNLKQGDEVVRDMCGVRMRLKVTGLVFVNGVLRVVEAGWWKFCALTGAEIDEELGWGPHMGVTGSTLVDVIPGGGG